MLATPYVKEEISISPLGIGGFLSKCQRETKQLISWGIEKENSRANFKEKQDRGTSPRAQDNNEPEHLKIRVYALQE